MPRRKAAEIEILPSEDGQQLRGRKKLVEAEHTIKYSAPVPVTVEDDSAESNLEEDLEFVEEEKAKRRKKTAKDERNELRRELDKLGVAAVSRLKLSIDKYRHSDSDDSGTLAEKDYCTKYPVTKEHILNDDYMDVARRYGPGRYWFTLRMDNVIARQWERQVNQTISPNGSIIQHVNPNDPTSPQVVVNMPEGSQQPITPIDPFKEAERALNLVEKYNRAFGRLQPQTGENPARSEEEILAAALLKQPELIENVVGSVIKRFGAKGGTDDEPGWSTVAMEAVKNNQIAASIQAFGNIALMFLDRILPSRGQNNGQAPMAQAEVANPGSVNPGASNQGAIQIRQDHNAQEQSQGNADPAQIDSNAGSQRQSTISPEEQALGMLIDHCRRNVPAQIACDRLISLADAINDQYPHLSIDGYISMFAAMPTEAALEFVKSQPNGEQVISLPHAKEWCAELQRLIKEAGEEGEE